MLTLLYQYANMTLGESYLVGEIDPNGALEKFQEFPWQEQLAEFQEKEINAPTYWLKNSKTQQEFIASIVTQDNFYVCMTENQIKRTLGLFPVKSKVNHSAYGLSLEEVAKGLELYLEGNPEALVQYLEEKSQSVSA
ncbi:MAG TPA: hypothetical protein DCE41_30175 [Cytophagales bacterium]|nr:hypothetical protein [Cytophagales bacterium]HAA20865.1 hypothetical protein [Cytophagales bacterium]HAP59154.1 hypothetical protein [Cytophagales bacterium]